MKYLVFLIIYSLFLHSCINHDIKNNEDSKIISAPSINTSTSDNSDHTVDDIIIWNFPPVNNISDSSQIQIVNENNSININTSSYNTNDSKLELLKENEHYSDINVFNNMNAINYFYNKYINNADYSTVDTDPQFYTIILSENNSNLVYRTNIAFQLDTIKSTNYKFYNYNYMFKYSDHFINTYSQFADKYTLDGMKRFQQINSSLLIGHNNFFYLYDLNKLGKTLNFYYSNSHSKFKGDPDTFIYYFKNGAINISMLNDSAGFIKLTYSEVYPYFFNQFRGIGANIKSTIFKINESNMNLEFVIDYFQAQYSDSDYYLKIIDDTQLINSVLAGDLEISNLLYKHENGNISSNGIIYKYVLEDNIYKIKSYNDF